jgi:hypothetical protein
MKTADGRGLLRAWHFDAAAILSLALMVLAIFGAGLFDAGDKVASCSAYDAGIYFAPNRAFGFGEMAAGRLPLWNPNVFSGSPYLGNFQSALLYPPNAVYLVLPLSKALNVDMAFHMLLTSVLMYCWARSHRLRPVASFFAATVVMFSASYYLHVLAGHLTMLAGLAWAPLVLLAVEKILARPRTAWVVAGALGVTMQVLAGLPQAAFLTGFTAGLYFLMRLPAAENRLGALFAFCLVFIIPIFASAAQLWPGLATALECTRESGVSYTFAASFSLPPENLLLALAPGFFGDVVHVAYWGKWTYWEVALFISVPGLLLAVLGGMASGRDSRRAIRLSWVAMACVLVVVALGDNTPLFSVLYHLPGFNLFRGAGRITFFATLFLGLLAGAGVHALFEKNRRIPIAAFVALVLTVALLAGAAWLDAYGLTSMSDSAWGRFISFILHSYPPSVPFARLSAHFAFTQLVIAVALCGASAALMLLCGWKPVAAYFLVALGLAELFIFAREHSTVFRLRNIIDTAQRELAGNHPGDYRIIDPMVNDNRAMLAGQKLVWGYDPVVTRRYMEFIAFTQGRRSIDPAWGLGCYEMDVHPLMSLLRLRYIAPEQNQPFREVEKTPLPRFLLLHDYVVFPERDAIFDVMESDGFNAARTIVLEREPAPKPDPAGKGGIIALVAETTDSVELQIDLPAPAILLVTDAYSRGWRVRALEPGPQEHYDVLPADYVLRAVPLEAGRHHLLMEYRLESFCIGIWVSVGACSVLAAVAAVILAMRSWRDCQMRRLTNANE